MKDLLAIRIEGPLAPYRDGLGAHLRARGYAPLSARNLLHVMAHISRWLKLEELHPGRFEAPQIEDYLRHRRKGGYVEWLSLRGLEPILEYLRNVGVVPPVPAAFIEPTPLEDLLGRYVRHLEGERGLTASTVCGYQRTARSFLIGRFGAEGLDLRSLSAADVTTSVQQEARSSSIGYMRVKLSALRSFLRFLHVGGELDGDLTGAVPAVAGARWAGLPRGPAPADVKKLVRSFDRRTHVGRRNYPIVLLLSRLGLRAGEVAALELEDIDWARGQCVIHGKGGREDCLPLPKDVGQAIASYLRRSRPKTESRRVFIQMRAPHRDITRYAIAQIVYQACKRAGLPRIGPHRLRHATATEMLRRGASLPEIAQVLRHRHLASTAIYAKVDQDALRPLGRPWLGGRR